MTPYHNPALREEPRGRPIKVSPLTGQESLLGWIESTGRFQSVENDDFQEKIPEDLDDILNTELYMLKDDEEQEDQE